jgi:hypothetical protein
MHTTAAHCKLEPIIHTRPERMTIFLRPIVSAMWLTNKAPAKEPAGMAETMAPCVFGPGYNSRTVSCWCRRGVGSIHCRISSCMRHSERGITKRLLASGSDAHSTRQTWTTCPDQRGDRQYMRRNQQCTKWMLTPVAKPQGGGTYRVRRNCGVVLRFET